MTLTGMPAKIASSMAGKPSLVPGNLDEEIGPLRSRMQLAWPASIVLGGVVGEQRRDFQGNPAVDAVCRSWIGRKRSAAWVRSSSASSKNNSSPDLPSRSFSRMASS